MIRKACHTRTLVVGITAVICVCFCFCVCSADVSIGNSWGDGIYRLYNNIVKPLATCMACFSMGCGGLMFFGLASNSRMGREKAMATGKKMIVYSAIALVAIWMLPLVYKLALEVFSSMRYTPA